MLKDKNFWSIHIKWGLILGIFLVGLEVVKMFARKVDYQGSQLLDIAMIIGFILILFYGVREFKDNYLERLSFSKAFLSTIVISFLGALIILGYDNIHYSVIEKDGLQSKYTVALEKYKSNLAKDTITSAELLVYTNSVDSIITAQKEHYFFENHLNDSVVTEVNNGIQIFQQYYSNKILSKPENDKKFYTLRDFSQYARRILVETLVSYTEQNVSKVSTDAVQTIIQNSNKSIEYIDPLENRFYSTKARVPRYDKMGKYATVSAIIYLIYGMFFGLFVAMFHYRSKNPIEPQTEPDVESEITEQSETE